jgi:DNA-binding GntR family transcriptional regulator
MVAGMPRKGGAEVSPVEAEPADPRAYVRLAAMIRGRIRDGTLGTGQPVPSITALTEEYGHARQTCSKAYQLLQEEGILARFPGLGYFVCQGSG